MSLRVQLLALAVVAACTKQPSDHVESRSRPSSDPPLVDVTASNDTGGIVSAPVAPSSSATQRVTASPSSAVPLASVSYPPGTLAAAGTVTIEESAPVVSDHLLTLIAGVDASVIAASAPAVRIEVEPAMDPAAPIQIRIPAPAAAGLETAPATLAVLYHAVQHAGGGKNFTGVLFADRLTLDSGTVSFSFGNYGAFQAVYLAAPDALPSSASTARQVTAPPLGKSAESKLAAFAWGTIEAQRSAQRDVVVSFAGQSDTLSDCSVHVDDDQTRPYLASHYFGTHTFATIRVPGESEIAVYARLACFDSAGRAVVSPWSGKVEFGEAAVASPSPETSSDSEPSPEVLGDETSPVPGALGALTASSVTAFSAKLTWAKAEDDVSPASKLSYRIYRSGQNDIDSLADIKKNGVAVGTALVDLDSSSIGSLGEATTYWLNVVVYDEAGNEAAYRSTQITTSDSSAPVPGNNGNLVLGTISASQVSLSWTGATDNVTGTAALRYGLYRSTSNNLGSVDALKLNGTAIGADLEAALTSMTASGLAESTGYYFNVLVEDAAGRQAVYTPVLARTTDITAPVPGAAGALTSGTITGSSIEVRWTAATDNGGNSGVTYSLYRSTSSNLGTLDLALANGTLVGTAFTTGTARTAASLSELGTYYFTVVAKDSSGNKSAYAQTSFTTSDISSPTAGSSGTITASGATGTTMGLSWTAATDNGTSTAALKYSVYYLAGGSSVEFDTMASVKAGTLFGAANQTALTAVTVTGLTSSTDYRFNVIVKDAKGNEALYDSVTATTADTTPPAVDSSTITVLGYTAKTATLQWTAGADNVTSAPSLTYSIHQLETNTFNAVSDVIAAPTSMASPEAGITTKQVTGLTPGTTYYFNIVVRDAAGNAAKYATVQQALPAVLGHAVQPATLTLSHVKTVAGEGSVGSVDDSDALQATLDSVIAMTTDGVDIFFAQANGKIRKLSTSASSVTTLATVTSPQGLASNGSYLYVSTGHAIKRIQLSDLSTTVVAGDEATSGNVTGSGSTARFNTPKTLASDATYLYIWDHANSSLRTMTLAYPYTVANLAGTQGSATIDDAADTLANVVGMTLAKNVPSTLYVVEDSHCIRQVGTTNGDVVTRIGSCGTADSVDASGTSARFDTPLSLVSTGSTLYLADSLNHSIRAISNPLVSHDVTTLSGDGTSGVESDGTVGTVDWSTPTLMASTINGIYVYDSANNVIRRIGLP